MQKHESFVLSGEASELLGPLSQYFKVDAVHHIDNDRRDMQSHKGGVDVDVSSSRRGSRANLMEFSMGWGRLEGGSWERKI